MRDFRIFPSIGIARVGNSASDWYIGPETPELGFLPPDRLHRDARGRIKRMAARFRVYEFEQNKPVREITLDNADIESIEWEVQVANTKAAGSNLNQNLPRADLKIESSIVKISGMHKSKAMNGELRASRPKTRVRLGDLKTDDAGRLLVLGGYGKAVTWTNATAHRIRNDGWYDDTSDGPVRARIRVAGQQHAEDAVSAWVVVGPPDFAHGMECIVTLYDLARDLAGPFLFRPHDADVYFADDIYRILRRTVYLQWTSAYARMGHTGSRAGNFLDPANFVKMHDKQATDADTARQDVLRRLKNPADPTASGNMPSLTSLTLTPTQYRRFERWADGDFVDDWNTNWNPLAPPERAFANIPVVEQPDTLTRAALDSCVGGSFNPGIEVDDTAAKQTTYEQPFRISRTISLGGLTSNLGVPWQADFKMCGDLWWPSARPNLVLDLEDPQGMPQQWDRDVHDNKDMVDKWKKLGFVVRDPTTVDVRYVESERIL